MFSRHGSLLVVYVFVASTKVVNVLRPDEICRRCNGNSKEGGVAAEGCSSQASLLFCTLPRDIDALIRTYCNYDQIIQRRKKKNAPSEVMSRDGHVLAGKISVCIS